MGTPDNKPLTKIQNEQGMTIQPYRSSEKKCLGAPSWLNKVPQGLRKLLSYIKKNYGDPEIYITENGWSEKGEEARVGEAALNDIERVGYYKEYINEALKATLLDVKLKGKHQ